MRRQILGFSVFSFLIALRAFADPIPHCLDNRRNHLPYMNEIVLDWKKQTPNLYEARAFIFGKVIEIYKDRNGHDHFAILIGKDKKQDTIEVVYNQAFGRLPDIHINDEVIACGDYITSNKAARYPASPDGAIIHWVHASPNAGKHQHGFVMVNGTLFGFREKPENSYKKGGGSGGAYKKKKPYYKPAFKKRKKYGYDYEPLEEFTKQNGWQ